MSSEDPVVPSEAQAVPGDEVAGQDSQAQDAIPALAQDRECVLDAHGDLWLHTQGVGSWGDNGTVKFKVCSRALARASVVFDAMLYGRFAESEKRVPGADWVVELPDDPGAAMEQLLGIMHGRFRSLSVPCYHRATRGVFKADELLLEPEPESSSSTMIAQLYDLTVLADKYDCIHILQPWATAWVSGLGALPEDPVEEQTLFHKAWVYYQLGDRIKYEQVVTSLIVDVPPSYCMGKKRGDPLQALPPGLLDTVRSEREKHVREILEPIRTTINSLLGARHVPAGVCRPRNLPGRTMTNSDLLACEARILGLLLRHLHSHSLWPLPDPSQVTTSALLLASIVKDLAAPENNVSNDSRHCLCRPSFLSKRRLGDVEFEEDSARDTLLFKYNAVWEEVQHISHQADLTSLVNPPMTDLQVMVLNITKPRPTSKVK